MKALQLTTSMKQKDNFKIVKQFTQYRLLVNHNKYTFQYIIHNKYWKIKTQHRILKWMQRHCI